MSALTEAVGTRKTPGTVKARKDQVQNNAGGYVFEVTPFDAFERFLILGTEGGTYYASQKAHTLQATDSMKKAFDLDGIRAVDTIVSISVNGRAPKNDQAVFALAYGASVDDDKVRKYALSKVNDVCRIGTHLFQFAEFVEKFRGWGRGLRNAVGDWYLDKDADQLAYQVTKYRQRNGWSHRDLLRLSHPVAPSGDVAQVFAFASAKDLNEFSLHGKKVETLDGFMKLRDAKSVSEVVGLIGAYNISHEMIPTEFKADSKVWSALLAKGMPMTAMVRNLGVMSANGTLKPMSDNVGLVVAKLRDEVAIRNSRIHPISILFALKTYESGHGFKGSGNWNPDSAIVDALNAAFYLSFDNVEPANKNTLIGLDVSGSMGWGTIANSNITPRDASAAMAMVTVRSEPKVHTMAFAGNFQKLALTKSDSLRGVVDKVSRLNFGSTNCALPMQYATKNDLDVDTFVVYTDNETYGGSEQPFQALRKYREKSGRDAKLIVVGMTATNFTIADPRDSGMLDVVGFDTSTPNILSAFSRGDF